MSPALRSILEQLSGAQGVDGVLDQFSDRDGIMVPVELPTSDVHGKRRDIAYPDLGIDGEPSLAGDQLSQSLRLLYFHDGSGLEARTTGGVISQQGIDLSQFAIDHLQRIEADPPRARASAYQTRCSDR